MKKKIIFLNFTKFLGNYDYYKYDLEKYNEYNLEVHELINIFYPKAILKYQHIKKIKNVLNFANYFFWKKYILNLKQKFNLIIWFQTLPTNLKILKLYQFLKSQKIKVILTSHGSIPYTSIKKRSLIDNIKRIPYRFQLLLKRPKTVISWYEKFLVLKIIKIFNTKLYPDFIITNGLKKYHDNKNFYSENTKIISINSWDLSRYYKKKIKKVFKKRYICYLSAGGPNAPGDSTYLGQSRLWSEKKYYYDLNSFFKKLEKEFRCKLIICAHPRTSSNFEKKNFSDFDIFYGKSMEIVKEALFVVSEGSSANSYSILFNKPCIFIDSDEHKKNPQHLEFISFFSNVIGGKVLNISKDFNKNELINNLKVDRKKYKSFLTLYLKSIYKNNQLPNYKIIKNKILKKI